MRFPVFKAFAAATAYVATHVLVLLKILWLPALLLTGALIYAMPGYLEAAMAAAGLESNPDPAKAMAVFKGLASTGGLLLLANLVLYPMMMAGVLRHVVRGEAPSLPFYLNLGGDELRLVLTIILIAIMVGLVYLVGVVGLVALSAAFVAVSPKIGGILAAVAGLAGIGALVWFALRLSMSLPATISVRKIGVAESWRVTKGAALRLLGYWLLWAVVLMIAGALYLALLTPEFFGAMGEMMKAAHDPSATAEIEHRMMQIQLAKWDRTQPGFWIFAGGNYLGTIAYLGVTYSALGVAYRYLAEKA
ncbi:MAG: hypothetical protein AB7P23_03440 [Amphiplicatus sp.]